MTGTGLREEPPEHPSAAERELRVALAMRGGVSLAVWIGGALAELDLARRAMVDPDSLTANTPAEQERGRRYAGLLQALGYTSIKVDVLAGASAGGLNAVIYGFAQSVGSDLEWLKGVWESKGDIWKLFHPQWSLAEAYRTEALFDADSNFYLPLLEELRRSAGSPRQGAVTDFLTIDLSATLQSGPPLPDIRTGEDIRPSTAHFRFRHTPAAPGEFNDVPSTTSGPGDDEYLRRLAYAARSTSSFPGAFEPAAIFSWRGATGRPPHRDDTLPENMASVFSEVAESPEQQFDVMDGGVFDNIPISRAIHAIADAPAGIRTSRILVYLDPTPPTPTVPPALTPLYDRRDERVLRARFLRSVAKAIRYKVTTESSWDGIRELETLWAQGTDRQFRRRRFMESHLPGGLFGAAATGLRQDDLLRRHREYRARVDSERLAQLLVTPGWGFLHTLVTPPRLGQVVGTPDVALLRVELATALLAEGGPNYPSHMDASALIEATDLLIAWVRGFQDSRPTDEQAELLASTKKTLYRIRTFGQFLRDSQDAVAVSGFLGPDQTADGLAAGTSTTPWSRESIAQLARDVWRPDVDPDSPPVDLGQEAFWDTMAAWDAAAPPPLAGAPAAWDALCEAIAPVVQYVAGPSRRNLRTVPDQPQPVTTERVQRLVAEANVLVGPMGTPAVPEFHVIGGDEAPVVELGEVDGYADLLRLDRQAAHPRLESPWQPGTMNAAAKLSGSQLANFGGFLAATWRAHDWAWGRADAGAGLIRILRTRRDHDRTAPGTVGGDAALDAAFANARTALRSVYDGLDSRPPQIADLGAGYRFALGARVALGLQRSLWPLTPSHRADGIKGPSAVPTAVMVALLSALRPLLVILPLILRPTVLAGALVSASLAMHLAPGPTGSGRTAELMPALVATGAAILVMAAASISRLSSWRAWGEVSMRSAGAAVLTCDEVRSTARREGGIRVAAMLALLALFGALLTRPGAASGPSGGVVPGIQAVMARATWFDLLLLLTGIGLWARQTNARACRKPHPIDRTGLAAAVVMVVSVLLPALAVRFGVLGPETSRPLETALAAAAVLWAVHHAWSARGWPTAIAVAGGVTTFLVTRLVDPGALLRWLPIEGYGQVLAYFLPWSIAPLVALGGTLLIILALRRLLSGAGSAGKWVFVGVSLVWMVWLVWQQTAVWPWLGEFPLALVIGSVAGAATTLVTPFRPSMGYAPD